MKATHVRHCDLYDGLAKAPGCHVTACGETVREGNWHQFVVRARVDTKQMVDSDPTCHRCANIAHMRAADSADKRTPRSES